LFFFANVIQLAIDRMLQAQWWMAVDLIRSRTTLGWSNCAALGGAMAKQERRQIVETPTEARQAEPGPSVLVLLVVGTGLAIIVLGIVWFVFFHT
jgi:hypothetical protein